MSTLWKPSALQWMMDGPAAEKARAVDAYKVSETETEGETERVQWERQERWMPARSVKDGQKKIKVRRTKRERN